MSVGNEKNYVCSCGESYFPISEIGFCEACDSDGVKLDKCKHCGNIAVVKDGYCEGCYRI